MVKLRFRSSSRALKNICEHMDLCKEILCMYVCVCVARTCGVRVGLGVPIYAYPWLTVDLINAGAFAQRHRSELGYTRADKCWRLRVHE
jgi:hypothetical protein